ncbi:MAG: PH domain-containing protein [Ornithinimicrobium sp.]
MLGFSATAESGVKVSSRILERYVLRGEQVEVATRQHWAIMSEPAATVVLGFFVVAWTSSGLEQVFGEFGLYLWWVWFGLIFRLMWKMLEWRNEWFVATDKRLLLTYGLFTHKVAMMPLGKVTDLNYGRSIAGRFLGYGTFTLESAGQDQALREINWLPDPDQTYRRICDIIFGPQTYDSEDSLSRGGRGRPAAAEPPRARFPSQRIAADSEMQQERREHRDDTADSHEDHDADPAEDHDADTADDERWVTDSQRAAQAAEHDAAPGPDEGDRPEPDGDAGWQTSPESASSFQSVDGHSEHGGPDGPDGPEPDQNGSDEDDDITGPIPRPPR